MKNVLIGVAFVLCWPHLAAFAQDAASAKPAQEIADARAKMRTACAADVQKLCADIERAKGARRACLDHNQANLSAECTAARAERAALRGKGSNSD